MNAHEQDPPAVSAPASSLRPPDFDDALYLMLNQDVAGAVAAGAYASGEAHYLAHGAREGRRYLPPLDEPVLPQGPVVLSLALLPAAPGFTPAQAARMMAHAVEALRVSAGGGVFVSGWIDDAADPLLELRIEGEGWSTSLAGGMLARVRRRDVEAVVSTSEPHGFGFCSFAELGHPILRGRRCRVNLRTARGVGVALDVECRGIGDIELRSLVLAGLVENDWFDSAWTAAGIGLDGGTGDQIVALNRRITAGAVADPVVQHFGPAGGTPTASIIVCLYGRPEYLPLQCTLFAGGAGMEGCEFVYVSNSPDLADRLSRDARIASLVHGTRITLVLLSGNAGFAAANNVAVRYARSERIIICNPDVIPLQPDWAQRHAELVATLPAERTALFGVPLFYETGALMHGGMYFEIDASVLTLPGGLAARETVRVQHYGKGAPPDTTDYLRARPVPAVTGAFISCRREVYERLGGFNEDYVFGHYEDADFCLRAIGLGITPWLHDVRMYHLEGQGSARHAAQQGAMIVNRWLFARTWATRVRDGLLGPEPSHKLMRTPAPRRRG